MQKIYQKRIFLVQIQRSVVSKNNVINLCIKLVQFDSWCVKGGYFVIVFKGLLIYYCYRNILKEIAVVVNPVS